ncbi:general transcription factor IIH subunit 3-like [Halichondria panicea]|uniref:general transcription factor IIH subunit 3-like n=1 Tax=Halichondria panicea TaxID=6063 RepID=UPI00312BBCC6
MANVEESGGDVEHLLVVIVDLCNAYEISASSKEHTQALSVKQCLDAVTTFINSYVLTCHGHSVAVCISHQAGSQMVYPSSMTSELSADDPRLQNTGKYEPLVHMNSILCDQVHQVVAKLSSAPADTVSTSTLLSGAISKSLCYIQRQNRELLIGRTLNSRILVVRSSSDSAPQYIHTMNCIFAALKNRVPIDSCVLWEDSGFLQQASDVTGGVYIRTPEPSGLLQYLLWVFLPDPSTRDHLLLPSSVEIDYRAACFCHHKLVDVGFVCSVCLSIFCRSTPICSMCNTHFKLPSLPTLMKSKKKKNHKHKGT